MLIATNMRHGESFQHGLATSCVAAGAILLGLYTGAAPTADIRARIPFLIAGNTSLFVTFVVFFVTGMGALVFTGGSTRRAVVGVAFGSLVNVGVLLSGLIPRIVPELSDDRLRWAAFAAVLLASTTVLIRERRTRRAPVRQ
jgi:hypothetical protein